MSAPAGTPAVPPATSPWRRTRRRLSRGAYRLLFGLYRALFPARGPTRRPLVTSAEGTGRLDPAALRRVLVVRDDRIGDLVVTTPVLSLLRAVAPNAEVDVLASRANAPLLDGDARVARVFVRPDGAAAWWRLVRQLRARRYDLVFSPVGVGHLRQGLLAALVAPAGAARVTPYRPAQYHGLFTHVVRAPRGERPMPCRLLHTVHAVLATGGAPRCAEAARWPMTLVERPEGAAAAEAFAAGLRARFGACAFVAVNAWAAEPWREFGVEYGGALLAALARRHPELPFVLTPPPGRAAEAARMAAAAGAPTVLVHPTLPHVLDLAALLRRAALVVTPDTANVHLAAAAGRPVLGLYTARTTDPAAWAPYGVPARVLLAPGGAPVTAVPVEAVARAFDALWGEAVAPGAADDASRSAAAMT